MARYRKIKRWGNSLVIVLTNADKKDLCLIEGDYIDIEDCTVMAAEMKNKVLTKSGRLKNGK